jgi:hypothetical protein
MTSERYRNYRRALELIEAVDPRRSVSPDRDLLTDLAEEMLLVRADQPVGKQARRVTDCLARLVETGAVERSIAEELWRAIRAAGPDEEEADAPAFAHTRPG